MLGLDDVAVGNCNVGLVSGLSIADKDAESPAQVELSPELLRDTVKDALAKLYGLASEPLPMDGLIQRHTPRVTKVAVHCGGHTPPHPSHNRMVHSNSAIQPSFKS